MIDSIRRMYRPFLIGCMFLSLTFCGNIPSTAEENRPEVAQVLRISDVAVSAPTFNPSRGDRVELRYHLSRNADVTVKVFDPDFELVRILTDKAHREAGEHREMWDGKDLDGEIVPNEAYFFTLEAETGDHSQQAIYDPITFSGGEPFEITQVTLDRKSGRIAYQLSQPSRVLIRIGIPDHALLKTLVDGEPRPAGEMTEGWNGKDEDDLIDLWNEKDLTTQITGFALPANSVITVGNHRKTYREYKSHLPKARPKKAARFMTKIRRLSPHFLASRTLDRSFKVVLNFPQLEALPQEGLPAVKEKPLVRVDVAETDREIFSNQPFTLFFFVDTLSFAKEAGNGLPFDFPWEVRHLPEGEHLLTVNLVTSNGRFGVGSKRVKVVNSSAGLKTHVQGAKSHVVGYHGKDGPQNSSPAIDLERLDQLKDVFQNESDQVHLIALLSPN
ncbi:hypothetical protein HYR99_26210 [Candidatus Poribacteria bacterium]|nr:hypothetical protein [Candidatus Poribacteria bacterium]